MMSRVEILKIIKSCVVVIILGLPLVLQAQNISGYWIDTLKIGHFQLRLVVHIVEQDYRYHADLYSIDQTDAVVPASKVEIAGDTISIVYNMINAKFKGIFNSTTDKINGIFKQGEVYQTSFHRLTALPAVERPQTPIPPFQYTEEEWTVAAAKNSPELKGTLTLPLIPCKAVAVLVAGSGPVTRNETIMRHEVFKVLSDRLTQSGIAVIRYDKRGVGESKGDYAKATVFDFAEDAKRVLLQAKKDKRFKDVPIGIVGHSEGGLIAEILAADKQASPDYVVLMAAPVQQCGSLLVDQVRMLMQASDVPAEEVEAGVRQQQFIVNMLQKYGEKTLDVFDNELQQYKQQLDTNGKEWQLWKDFNKWKSLLPSYPWLCSFVNIDPEKYICRSRCDILFLGGDKDVQVPAVKNADLLYQYLPEDVLLKKKQKLRVIVFTDRNHLFQTCTTGLPYEYTFISETMGEDVMFAISKWISGDR